MSATKDVWWLAYRDKKDRKLSIKLEGFELDENTYPYWKHKEAVNDHFKAIAEIVMGIEK